jgi:hypothetical protein
MQAGDNWAYNVSPFPWETTFVGPSFSEYNADDGNRMDVGLEGVVKGGKSLLVPFHDEHYAMMYVSGLAGPLFPPKMEVNVVQFRMEINVHSDSMSRKSRPIHIPASVRVGYPQIELVSLEPSTDTAMKMFWGSLIEASMHAFQCDEFVFPGNNQPRQIFGFNDPAGFVQFEAVSEKRIGAALHQICTKKLLTAMVPVFENPGVYVALVRMRGTFVKAYSIRFVHEERRFSQRRFVFPPEIHQTYPDIHFFNEYLTNADVRELVQEPIKDYHRTLWKEIEEEYGFYSRLTALAMGLHPRLGSGAHVNTLNKDNIVFIARMLARHTQ